MTIARLKGLALGVAVARIIVTIPIWLPVMFIAIGADMRDDEETVEWADRIIYRVSGIGNG